MVGPSAWTHPRLHLFLTSPQTLALRAVQDAVEAAGAGERERAEHLARAAAGADAAAAALAAAEQRAAREQRSTSTALQARKQGPTTTAFQKRELTSSPPQRCSHRSRRPPVQLGRGGGPAQLCRNAWALALQTVLAAPDPSHPRAHSVHDGLQGPPQFQRIHVMCSLSFKGL